MQDTQELPVSTLTKNQKQVFWKQIDFEGKKRWLEINIRYDDECGNGHNTFAITGTVWKRQGSTSDSNHIVGGCIHDIITEHAPEYAHLIQWHLVSSDSPMHYVSNTLYHSRTTDCWGLEKGEKQIISYAYYLEVNKSPIKYKLSKELLDIVHSLENHPGLTKDAWAQAEIESVHHKEPETFSCNYSIKGFGHDWYKAPFKSLEDAEMFIDCMVNHDCRIVEEPDSVRIGKGSEPDLEAARNTACAPDATLEQLQDEAWLEARLPELMHRFKDAMETQGFTY